MADLYRSYEDYLILDFYVTFKKLYIVKEVQ